MPNPNTPNNDNSTSTTMYDLNTANSINVNSNRTIAELMNNFKITVDDYIKSKNYEMGKIDNIPDIIVDHYNKRTNNNKSNNNISMKNLDDAFLHHSAKIPNTTLKLSDLKYFNNRQL